MHGGASSSLCVRAKNQQILVRDECYANRLQMAQRRFAVPSTHMRIWFASDSRTIRGARVYEALRVEELIFKIFVPNFQGLPR